MAVGGSGSIRAMGSSPAGVPTFPFGAHRKDVPPTWSQLLHSPASQKSSKMGRKESPSPPILAGSSVTLALPGSATSFRWKAGVPSRPQREEASAFPGIGFEGSNTPLTPVPDRHSSCVELASVQPCCPRRAAVATTTGRETGARTAESPLALAVVALAPTLRPTPATAAALLGQWGCMFEPLPPPRPRQWQFLLLPFALCLQLLLSSGMRARTWKNKGSRAASQNGQAGAFLPSHLAALLGGGAVQELTPQGRNIFPMCSKGKVGTPGLPPVQQLPPHCSLSAMTSDYITHLSDRLESKGRKEEEKQELITVVEYLSNQLKAERKRKVHDFLKAQMDKGLLKQKAYMNSTNYSDLFYNTTKDDYKWNNRKS
ncbi:hypothetical protein E2320_011006, partial [Naja naja]